MKRILVLEDDAFIRDITSEKLAHAGFDVDISESGEDAVIKIEAGLVDLLLLDLQLEGMQGTEVLEHMYTNGITETVPVIVFSNNDEPEIREKCRQLGAKSFFVKVDTDHSELINEIYAALSQ